MILHGSSAVKAVEEREGRKLSYGEKRVVLVEGYATEIYPDTKNIPTNGVGQTGQWLHRSFKDAYQHHVERVRRRLPDFDSYPEYLQAELMQAEYRGDLGLSPKAMGYLKDQRYRMAASEFLDNAEYKHHATSRGIKKRLEAVQYAILLYSVQQ